MAGKLVSRGLFLLGVLGSLGVLGGCAEEDGPAASDVLGQVEGAAQAADVITGSGGYPRIVRLVDTRGLPIGRMLSTSGGKLYQSSNQGNNWAPFKTMPIPSDYERRCCETLYALPEKVGNFPIGTLIYAGSYLKQGRPAIAYFTSTDQGETWIFRGAPVVTVAGPIEHRGVWEPEFAIGSEGALIMYFSDERDSDDSAPADGKRHSQRLAEIRSFNGLDWVDEQVVFASDAAGTDRPGMPRVSKLKNGHYFMTYEFIRGGQAQMFARTSTSGGWFWGDPHFPGFRPTDAQGEYFTASPMSVWIDAPGSANGAIIAAGRKLSTRDGNDAPDSGRVLFVNYNVDGTGAWSKIPAPVKITNFSDNTCQNYSSAILPAMDGLSFIHLAGDFGADGTCSVFYAKDNL